MRRDLRIGVALSKSESDEIKERAKTLGITPGEFIRYAIFRFIKYCPIAVDESIEIHGSE